MSRSGPVPTDPARAHCRRWMFGLAAALVLASGSAGGHSNEYLATIKGAHGGQLRMAEMYHFELVVGEGEIRVWVTDHGDQPIATANATASAVVMNGADRIIVNLTPAGENGLLGKDPRLKVALSPRVALTVTMTGHGPLQVRYAPPPPRAAAAGD